MDCQFHFEIILQLQMNFFLWILTSENCVKKQLKEKFYLVLFDDRVRDADKEHFE